LKNIIFDVVTYR